jgi:hypothetical protein
MALCISSAAFASRFVSILIPTPHPLQLMWSLSVRLAIVCSSSYPHFGIEI